MEFGLAKACSRDNWHFSLRKLLVVCFATLLTSIEKKYWHVRIRNDLILLLNEFLFVLSIKFLLKGNVANFHTAR